MGLKRFWGPLGTPGESVKLREARFRFRVQDRDVGAWPWREGATGKRVRLREQAGHWEWRVLSGGGRAQGPAGAGGRRPPGRGMLCL